MELEYSLLKWGNIQITLISCRNKNYAAYHKDIVHYYPAQYTICLFFTNKNVHIMYESIS